MKISKEAHSQALASFKASAPELSESQVNALIQTWSDVQDIVISNMDISRSMSTNDTICDQSLEEIADETMAVFGCAMVETYEL